MAGEVQRRLEPTARRARDGPPLGCITFDLDATSLWVTTFRTTSPSAVSRGEFEAEVAVPRILAMLHARELTATFFVPGIVAEWHPSTIRAIQAGGHELASHGDRHERQDGMEPSEELTSIRRGIERLAAITSEPPAGFRAPAWALSVATIGVLEDLGLRYDSSQSARDYLPYRARRGDVIAPGTWERGEPSSLWEVPVAWELNDFPHFFTHPPQFFGTSTPDQALDAWSGELEFMLATAPQGIYTLTLHPQLIGRGPRLLALGRLLDLALELGMSFVRVSDALDEFK